MIKNNKIISEDTIISDNEGAFRIWISNEEVRIFILQYSSTNIFFLTREETVIVLSLSLYLSNGGEKSGDN